ncbi:MAG: SDR family NAD(P)-dependent oxidoreductase [Salaquimonas sp.]
MALYTARPNDGAVWITGGSTGIGAETAIRLANEGFTVYVSARSKDDLKKLADGYSGKGKIKALPLDVTNRQDCQKAVDQIIAEENAISIAMFNAGLFEHMSGSNLMLDSFEKTFAVNFSGVVNCLVPAVDKMKVAGRGHVIVVGSVSGYAGLKLASAYGASKAALINMCESLKFDFDKINIKIQLVNPGFVDTPMTEQNKFPMPFLMPLDKAADRLVAKMKTDAFEITFPRRFTYLLKFASSLPYWLYFPLMGKATSGGKK